MNRLNLVRSAALIVLTVGIHTGVVWGFEGEDYEEPAGLCFAVYGNPSAGAWCFGFEDGTWLVNTPIMGQAFLHGVHLSRNDAWYGSFGMTLRLMPRRAVAPFVGAGGGYFQVSSSRESDERRSDANAIEAESFWGGIVEAGIRANLSDGAHFVDISVRHVWNSVEERLDFTAGGMAYGQRW